jgi:hypothetical protein
MSVPCRPQAVDLIGVISGIKFQIRSSDPVALDRLRTAAPKCPAVTDVTPHVREEPAARLSMRSMDR